MAFAPFDYDSLIVGAYYQGIDNGRLDEDGNPSREVPFVGKFLGFGAEQQLKALKNPESRSARQVGLLMNDGKYGRVWRFFDPETLTLVEPTEDQIVED